MFLPEVPVLYTSDISCDLNISGVVQSEHKSLQIANHAKQQQKEQVQHIILRLLCICMSTERN
jgi:hypothetical protein